MNDWQRARDIALQERGARGQRRLASMDRGDASVSALTPSSSIDAAHFQPAYENEAMKGNAERPNHDGSGAVWVGCEAYSALS